MAAGLLTYRNIPDAETGLSPAQIVFGRNLRDLLPIAPQTQVFTSDAVHPAWRDAWTRQEEALRIRFAKQLDVLTPHTRQLPLLPPGSTVLLQNQAGPHSKRWDRTGVVVETMPHDQYLVKVHGSGRITVRNRQYLRQIQPLHPTSPATGLPPISLPAPPAGVTVPCDAPPTMGSESGAPPAGTTPTSSTTSSPDPEGARASEMDTERRGSDKDLACVTPEDSTTAPPEPLVPEARRSPNLRHGPGVHTRASLSPASTTGHAGPSDERYPDVQPSAAPARPKRARRRPGYLADYECSALFM